MGGDLPGLMEHHFLKGIKGAQGGQYVAVWGTPGSRLIIRAQSRIIRRAPQQWEQLLAPFLDQEPDRIEFTAYEEL